MVEANWSSADDGGVNVIARDEDTRVRFDTIGAIVLAENKALLQHHINCLGADFAG